MDTLPQFSTKARTLASLLDRLTCAEVLPVVFFNVADWQAESDRMLVRVQESLGAGPWVVRSSALNEDAATASMAGHYTSVLDVRCLEELREVVERVIASYGLSPGPGDEVLVQPMLSSVRLSGVVFSCDPATGSPYRVVNYSLGTDSTAVTGGAAQTKTFVAATGVKNLPPDMSRVVALIEELEALFPAKPLDVEFAIAAPGDRLYLLQVRPLVMQRAVASSESHNALLSRVADKVRAAQRPHPFLQGCSTVFGVMPDWNPAEIIGIRPRPLALSLYRELVTDAIWAYQRDNYGYRNLRSFPLLVHFAGQPYIDVRLSFNSFIPKDVEGSLADRLVDYYIGRLTAAPNLHDKVEFEIVFSCYTLDLPERLNVLAEAGFSAEDRNQLAESLRTLTNRVIDQQNGLWRSDEAKLAVLSQRREGILASDLDPIGRIYWLLEDCKRYGTLPFAGLARAGFIAVQMLKSLVAVGVLSVDDYDRFMGGLSTVSSQLARDLRSLERKTFLARYGHLRPGTYDILSPRYDETPDDYLGQSCSLEEADSKRTQFTLSLDQMRAIARLLEEHGLSSDVVSLFDFLQAGIELREYAKFVFTHNLSDALSLFQEWGGGYGFSKEDLSYASINCIRELHAGADDPRTMLERVIEEGKIRYKETCSLWLPPLITHPDDVWAFHVPECEPNFVTQSSVTGPVVRPTERNRLKGGIVFIPSADPGYDWLFSHPIAGLVTAYGGVNSHMAIRANELGLPAVIGAGESLFAQWCQSQLLHIDCAVRRVEVLA
ncbi:MAG: phosphoenolpyruvate synthase [Gammaproteobacteria bacterium]|nr:phosphoenolpyruvate synthase [Gammaproteobacteria bacterium]